MATYVTRPPAGQISDPDDQSAGRYRRLLVAVTIIGSVLLTGALVARLILAPLGTTVPALARLTTTPSPTVTPHLLVQPAATATHAPTQPTALRQTLATPTQTTPTRALTQPTALRQTLVTPTRALTQPTALRQTLVTPTRALTQPTAPQQTPATPTSVPPTAAPQQTPATPTSVPATPTSLPQGTRMPSRPVTSERIRNGNFESGFNDQGVGVGWNHFITGAATYAFSDESWPPARYDGEHAQRIRVEGATEPDRYAGIFQTVTVVPGATYQLSLHGLIRTGQGDVKVSGYGYRIEVGFDYNGGQDWKRVQVWIELPWDEQRLDAQKPVFDEYQVPVAPPHSRMTVFIRTWNKWPEAGRVEYSLDGISLVGPISAQQTSAAADMPVTGAVLSADSPMGWASCVAVLLLVAGAGWHACQGVGCHERRTRTV